MPPPVSHLQVEEARPRIEVLAEDYPPAAVLLQPLVVADAQRPLLLSTVRQLEQVAVAILRELRPRGCIRKFRDAAPAHQAGCDRPSGLAARDR